MPRVFAPQLPSRFDSATKLWIPTVNISPAEKFGELKVMFPPNANRLATVPLVASMREQMESFTKDDYLVAVGDPSLIAAAACLAVRKTGGILRLLKWDRMASDYICAELKL